MGEQLDLVEWIEDMARRKKTKAKKFDQLRDQMKPEDRKSVV